MRFFAFEVFTKDIRNGLGDLFLSITISTISQFLSSLSSG
jgi:hypothetical protein